MLEIEHYKQLDNLILDETNVKVISRRVLESDKGTIYLQYDGKDYSFVLNEEDVTTPKLLEILPGLLEQLFKI
jgi:hypothetical protein